MLSMNSWQRLWILALCDPVLWWNDRGSAGVIRHEKPGLFALLNSRGKKSKKTAENQDQKTSEPDIFSQLRESTLTHACVRDHYILLQTFKRMQVAKSKQPPHLGLLRTALSLYYILKSPVVPSRQRCKACSTPSGQGVDHVSVSACVLNPHLFSISL